MCVIEYIKVPVVNILPNLGNWLSLHVDPRELLPNVSLRNVVETI